MVFFIGCFSLGFEDEPATTGVEYLPIIGAMSGYRFEIHKPVVEMAAADHRFGDAVAASPLPLTRVHIPSFSKFSLIFAASLTASASRPSSSACRARSVAAKSKFSSSASGVTPT